MYYFLDYVCIFAFYDINSDTEKMYKINHIKITK